ncbi:MAG: 16S rRNA (adenine(1518)-N(6)/adenine(1519)-N(6))-dimethyltransferase, partial [Actinomycetota bacterium]|nr:16S rRNA (adenine(1518)-N(6)/adenine(1519)-N(6))-dimethyltransferase [Actinomycetota bacterium]
SAERAEAALRAAGIDPRTRGEQLDIVAFAALAAARRDLPPPG